MTPFDFIERRINDWKTARNLRRMLVLEDLHAGYIPIAKVASTSLRQFLCQRQARVLYPNTPGPDLRALQKKMEKRIRRSLDPDEALRFSADHYVFAFVRNPLTRLYSCYLDKVVKAAQLGKACRLHLYGIHTKMSLDDFVRCVADIPDDQSDQHFRSQHLYLRADDKWLPRFIGRFENLGADWERIAHQVGITESPVIQRSTGAGNALDKIPMSRGATERAVARYAEDIELFGYQTEIARWLRSWN